jgi:hypothetical protein
MQRSPRFGRICREALALWLLHYPSPLSNPSALVNSTYVRRCLPLSIRPIKHMTLLQGREGVTIGPMSHPPLLLLRHHLIVPAPANAARARLSQDGQQKGVGPSDVGTMTQVGKHASRGPSNRTHNNGDDYARSVQVPNHVRHTIDELVWHKEITRTCGCPADTCQCKHCQYWRDKVTWCGTHLCLGCGRGPHPRLGLGRHGVG